VSHGRRRASASVPAIFGAVLVALLVLALGSLTGVSAARAAGSRGSLTVQVTGLPDGVSPKVVVHGVSTPFSRTLTSLGKRTFRDLPIGRYRVRAAPVLMHETTRAGSVAGLHASAQLSCVPYSTCERGGVIQVVSYGHNQRQVNVSYTSGRAVGPAHFTEFANAWLSVCGLRQRRDRPMLGDPAVGHLSTTSGTLKVDRQRHRERGLRDPP
jgi:hypothetical protein